jgi:CRISPR-associated endonuclease Cas1
MAASHTLSQSFAIPQISKLGVLTLHGYGIRLRMQGGHLETEHGIGPERYKLRLPRVNHRLKRLVCIGDDGFVTLSALRWLSDVGASFVMLDRLGKVRVVTGPASPSEARLRRAQALALTNGAALPIARELIAAKLDGQERVVRETLKNEVTANIILTLRKGLSSAGSIDAIRGFESRAASEYWRAWYDVPVLFPRNDAKRVPQHWLRFGTRHSPLTGGPRLAVNPTNALLNYSMAVAQSECRLAAVACGLDPGLGFIHTDTANRDSLALDLIETIRPAIEAWLLDWISSEPLRRSDFFESSDGNCRISSALCSKLSETALTWRKLVAPWAEYVAHSLYAGRASHTRCVPGIKTPLTQRHRREAKSNPVEKMAVPNGAHICRGCGNPVHRKSGECWKCAQGTRANTMRDVARLGRLASRQPDAREKLSRTAHKQAVARFCWNASQLPTWLTRESFIQRVQPRLMHVPPSRLRDSLHVSHYYATKIRKGYVPHPRHWKTLADLVDSLSYHA